MSKEIPEFIADFRKRLALVLKDLKEAGAKDPESMWITGSLAAAIMERSGKKSWPETKAALDTNNYNSLIQQLETQGNELVAKGNEKAAYAVQAVAVSVVAGRVDDPVVAEGNKLMDQLIDAAVKFFHQHPNSAKPN